MELLPISLFLECDNFTDIFPHVGSSLQDIISRQEKEEALGEAGSPVFSE
jgi:hypothetical protein